jgi:hypothetical protein
MEHWFVRQCFKYQWKIALLALLLLNLSACGQPEVTTVKHCKQLAPALVKLQFGLSATPDIDWLMAIEDIEDEVQIKVILSFKTLSSEPMTLQNIEQDTIDLRTNASALHPQAYTSETPMSMVCHYHYFPPHVEDAESAYNAYPDDIILNNHMVGIEIIKDIQSSL